MAGFWLQVDYPSSTAQVHQNGCRHTRKQVMDPATGYRRGYPTLNEARRAALGSGMRNFGDCPGCIR